MDYISPLLRMNEWMNEQTIRTFVTGFYCLYGMSVHTFIISSNTVVTIQKQIFGSWKHQVLHNLFPTLTIILFLIILTLYMTVKKVLFLILQNLFEFLYVCVNNLIQISQDELRLCIGSNVYHISTSGMCQDRLTAQQKWNIRWYCFCRPSPFIISADRNNTIWCFMG